MKSVLAGLVVCAALTAVAEAKEGMFTPDQLPEITEDLRATGLELDPAELTDLTAFPMGAVISLGGCTASFVSPHGLVVTNHHCARGSIQFNSTPDANYLENGFYARRLADELPAAPGTRVYVTVDVRDVTAEVRAGLGAGQSGRDVYDTIDARRKALVAACEQQPGHRCQVASFYGGLQYKLIDRLEIRDVRLVYAPGDSIGKYGGDIDNWMWPRHTGDFAFYRAYVGPDGLPADHAETNVPFQPEHFLNVSAGGLEAGDFIMAAGYPGSTQRYARLAEVEHAFGWEYPAWAEMLEDWIAVIEAAAPEGSDARIKYESRLAGLNNFLKNIYGQLSGAQRVGLVERRGEREAALQAWLSTQPGAADALQTLRALDELSEQNAFQDRRDFWYDHVRRPQLVGVARRLYRLAHEKTKPDAERETGYQERDLNFLRQFMERVDRRYDPAVDRAEWLLFLEGYMAQPQRYRVPAFDAALGLGETFDRETASARLDEMYGNTSLDNLDTRLALMEAPVADLDASTDPFIVLARAIFEHDLAAEDADKDRAGRMALRRPAYMQAIKDWQRDQGYSAYPDANSTLRVTYGKVLGGSPKDGLIYEPFTRLEGIVEKHTGEDPFNAPEALRSEVAERDYGDYWLPSIGSVPVNFLSDLDSTGGNSGSPTLNARGELVGLLFDGTFESVNSDWDFDPRTTRTIHVDTRYMLWVMDKVDGANRLLQEMTIVR